MKKLIVLLSVLLGMVLVFSPCVNAGDPTTNSGTKGDLNGDGVVNLADTIIGLKILSDIDVSSLIKADYSVLKSDVNGDGKIGLEELIYILQSISGLRIKMDIGITETFTNNAVILESTTVTFEDRKETTVRNAAGEKVVTATVTLNGITLIFPETEGKTEINFIPIRFQTLVFFVFYTYKYQNQISFFDSELVLHPLCQNSHRIFQLIV